MRIGRKAVIGYDVNVDGIEGVVGIDEKGRAGFFVKTTVRELRKTFVKERVV